MLYFECLSSNVVFGWCLPDITFEFITTSEGNMKTTAQSSQMICHDFWELFGYFRPFIVTFIIACVQSPVNATQNLALGKPAYQYVVPINPIMVASNAVDGNTNGNLNLGESCSHTDSISDAWWKVDLGDIYVIDHVILYNRVDCCGERLKHVQLFIGLHDSDYTLHGYHDGIVGTSYTFNLPSYVYGRWVMITRVSGTEDGELALCEVQVMGNTISNVLKYRQDQGVIGTGVSLGSSQAITKVACCTQCKMTTHCVAVNYFSDTGLCEKFETVTSTSDSNESSYFYRLN